MLLKNQKTLVFLTLISCSLLFLSSCSSTPEGTAANGVRWYKLYRCNGCHGENGSGGKAPVVADTSLSFRKFKHKLRSPHSAIMPAYEADRLPDKDAGEIYLWLKEQKKQG